MIDIYLNDLQNSFQNIFFDGNILICSNLKNIAVSQDSICFKDMVTIAFYTGKGSNIRINSENYALKENSLLILSPNTVVDVGKENMEGGLSIIAFSLRCLSPTDFLLGDNIFGILQYLSNNPVINLYSKSAKSFSCYLKLLFFSIQEKSKNIYDKENFKLLLKCIFYNIFSMVEEEFLDNTKADKKSLRGSTIMKDFFILINKYEGKKRFVKDYADELNISAKYLSTVVKQLSGRNAQEWIHNQTVKSIIYQMKYTEKNMQEIAYDMNFSDISFFGKFFKQQTGYSPLAYKKKIVRNS